MAGRARFPFPPYPDGWYHVADSDEVEPGRERTFRYFGRELRCGRDKHGRPRATCEGRAWPIDERNGSLLVYFDGVEPGREPDWRVPHLEACSSPRWLRHAERRWTVRCPPQELAENIVDTAHIKFLHGADRIPELERAEGVGHRFIVETRTPSDDRAAAFVSRFRVTEHALGYSAFEFFGAVEALVLARRTPIDPETIDLRVSFHLRKGEDPRATRAIGDAFVSRFSAEVEADIPILEHKIHVHPPLLCDGDGPIGAWRSWCRQFYRQAPEGRAQ
jgi:3-ketosteroid 9alpha-monooxygenase subunit A